MNEKNESSVSLADLWHAVWKNKLIILIITVAVTLLGIIYTFAIAKPKYKSEAHVLVAVATQGNEDNVDYTNSLKVVTTMASLVTENCVLDPVADAHEGLTSEDLKSMVSAEGSSSSYLITISVKCGDQALCQVLADELADELVLVSTTNEAVATLKPKCTKTSAATKASYSSPNKKLYVLVSFVLGLVLSCVVVFLKEFMSTKFKNKDEVEEITGMKILSGFSDKKSKEKDNKDLKLIDSSNIAELEEYNLLLGNLKYADIEHPYKAIAISSSVENELKTTVLCNLGIAMENNNKKVVILDLDIKRPTVHKAFGVEKADGLAEYVEGSISYENLIKHTNSGCDVVTAGKNVFNTLAILESEHLKSLIDKLKEDYDYVLIDTTPVSVSADSMVALKYADGVMFNVSINQTKKKLAAENIRMLKDHGIKIIGCNVNKIPKSDHDSYYYYSYAEKK